MRRLCLLVIAAAAIGACAQTASIKCSGYENSIPGYTSVPPKDMRMAPNGKLYCGVTVEVLETRADGWSQVKLPTSGTKYFVSTGSVDFRPNTTSSVKPTPTPTPTQSSADVFDLVMSSEELQSTGISKLDAVQRAALANWLIRYTQVVRSTATATESNQRAQASLAPSVAVSARSPQVVESKIDGDFEG